LGLKALPVEGLVDELIVLMPPGCCKLVWYQLMTLLLRIGGTVIFPSIMWTCTFQMSLF
jgi:hypothetical protein